MNRLNIALSWFAALLLSGCGGSGVNLDVVNSPSSLKPVITATGMGQTPELSQTTIGQAQMELQAVPIPDGVDPGLWEELNDSLLTALEEQLDRTASILPDEGRNIIDDLELVDIGGGEFTLEWTYRNAGDYDNNGEVNISDISPIAVHFGKTSADAEWSSAQTADGDNNGEVNLSDISPIAINFLSTVSGYNIYASDYEDGPWLKQGSIELGEASAGFPRMFSYAYGAQEHAFVTIAPFDSTGADSIANSGGTTTKYIPGELTVLISQSIDYGGGQLVGSGDLDGIVVDIPVGALDRPETISLGSDDGMILPLVGTWGGTIIDISGPNPILFEEPIIITAPFSGDPEVVPVPYYIREDGNMEICILTDLDRGAGTFSFATEHTSRYSWVYAVLNEKSGEFQAPGYTPDTYGFKIGNRGSFYVAGGECLGMTSFSQWYYRYGPKELPFNPRFMYSLGTDNGGRTIYGQDVIATRSHSAVFESQVRWLKTGGPMNGTTAEQVLAIRHAILSTSAPVNVGLVYGLTESGFISGHAVLAYGYTPDSLLIYDPNFPEVPLKIDLMEDSFYYEFGEHFDDIFCLGSGTFSRESFHDILEDAEGGFTGSENALITGLNYQDNDTVAEHQIFLLGNISSSEVLVERLKVVNDDVIREVPVDTVGGSFNIQVPIKDGDNELKFITMGRDGYGNWVDTPNNYNALGGLKLIGNLPPDKLRITLTWDQNNSFGLFIKEPSGDWLRGTRASNHDMSLKTEAGGYFEGSYVSGGPLHFVIPHDGTLDDGPYQFQVINTSTVDLDGVVPANWDLSISFNEGPPQNFNGYLAEGNNSMFPPLWGDPEEDLFLSPVFIVNYE